jgi:chaperone modulatory protein CbpM
MSENDLIPLDALSLDDEIGLTLAELCRRCDLAAEELIAMVEEGVLDPSGASPQQWRFSPADLYRLHAGLRLRRDLGLNLAGVALALDLLDEMRAMRARIAILEQLMQ